MSKGRSPSMHRASVEEKVKTEDAEENENVLFMWDAEENENIMLWVS